MIDRYKHQQLRIGLVSPQQISAWAKRILPNGEIVGEVTKPSTFDYQSEKPDEGGLFCERIFGPIKSGICACGKSQTEEKEKFCNECGVEFVHSRIRRYQMGYIKLACPVTHVWYLKQRPSYIANLLDKPLKEVEDLVYSDCSFARPIAKKPTFFRLRGSFEYEEIESLESNMSCFLSTEGFATFRNREISTGAGGIREQLADLDMQIIIDCALVEWKGLADWESSGDKDEDEKVRRRKAKLVRRLELAKHFLETNIEPEWMVLCLLPVLPPDLRPMISIEGNQKLYTSDLTELYRRVILRNNELKSYLANQFSTKGLIMGQEKLVQEAVDALLDNGLHGEPMRDPQKKAYKSFSDILQGKEGRFRQTMLGKRVDYSGRSVIVVGPPLSLHQCGLPRELAIVLFQTFLIRDLIRHHIASNLVDAKRKIKQKWPVVWKILQEVVQGHPVLLNRAPTLHRLGIQAFQPVLVQERAICLHPLVCKGFNADFDGDQMAVHVPLSLEAQAEAHLLMVSHMNLLSPNMGDPICVPTQDMLIGLYVLTSGNRQGICANRYNPSNRRNFQNERIGDNSDKSMKEPFFWNSNDAIGAYRQKRINLDSLLWLRWECDQRLITSGETPIQGYYESLGTYQEIYAHYLIVRSVKKQQNPCIYIRTTVGHISFYREIEEAIQGFEKTDSDGT